MASAPVAVLVGLGPGLGRSVALRFAQEGFAIGIMARSQEKLAPVQAEIQQQGSVLGVTADATDPNSMRAGFDQIQQQLGAPQVLIYNAGAFVMGGILDLTPAQFEHCWKTNCMGAFLAAQQVLPAMVERGQGTILLTGATAALRGSARFSGLAVGKFGLRALAQSLAREFAPQGIHVAHIVIDGQIDTPKLRARTPEREDHTLLNPDAIADTYWHLHRQDPTVWTLELDVRPAVEKF